MIEAQHLQELDSATQTKWFNSRIISIEGNATKIRQFIPSFETRPFGLMQTANEHPRINENYKVIVRRPHGNDKSFFPVGVVSKDYTLIQHVDVLDGAIRALVEAKINPADVKAQLKITEHGERISLNLCLPDQYNFDPGDGHPMALRLECLNSIDGSTRFRILMGWYRLVCSNGLIVGVGYSDVRRRHLGEISLDEISRSFESRLKETEFDKINFTYWLQIAITIDKLIPWIENDLRKAWGFKAATRAFHIALHGQDVEVSEQYRDKSPTTIRVKKISLVPGAPLKCSNLFDLSQILAWLAKERRDVQDQLEWRENIPALMAPFLK